MRFSNVRLRNGLGSVTAHGRVHSPPDGSAFAVAGALEEEGTLYYVADVGEPVAILSGSGKVEVNLGPQEALKIAQCLVGSGLAAAVWQEHGHGELRCFSNDPFAHERAAAAMWVLRTRGGWEEMASTVMDILQITGVREKETTAHIEGIAHHVQVSEHDHVDTKVIPSGRNAILRLPNDALAGGGVVMADIDQFRVYNDAYGFRAGNIVLCRVLDSLCTIADRFDCDVARVGGDEFALAARHSEFDPAMCAEAIRAAVYELAIPFEHPEVVIPGGRVSVSVGVPAPGSVATVKERLEDAVSQAKAAGRNTIYVASDAP